MIGRKYRKSNSLNFSGVGKGRATAAQIRLVMDFAMAHDVFISYEKKDLAVANAICRKLEEAGVSVWYAPRNILPGADWPESVMRAIDGCRVFVLIYSEKSDASDFVRREITCATTARKTIIPFCLSPMSKTSGLAFFCTTSQWLDAFPPPLAPHYQKLLKTTQNHLGQTRPGVAPRNKLPPVNARPSLSLISQVETTGATVKTGAPKPLPKMALLAVPMLCLIVAAAYFIDGDRNGVATSPAATGDKAAAETPFRDCSGKIAYSENTSLAGMDDVNGVAEVICMDSLKIRDKTIKLAGIGAEKSHAVKQLSDWIVRNGPTVHCQPVFFGASSYHCDVGSERTDVGQYVLAHHWAAPQE